jgi:nitrogen fixation protein FixH
VSSVTREPLTAGGGSEGATRSRGLFWALVPVLLLGSSLLGVGTMVSIAVHDPSFALEKNYYERGVHWDRQREQEETNERLGYGVELALRKAPHGVELEVALADRALVPLSGAEVKVEAFANARAGERRYLTLTPDAEGRYRAPLGRAQAGLWEFRLDVRARGEHFTRTLRKDVPPREGS